MPSSKEIFQAGVFPPALQPGCRVWTEHGYAQHGPVDGAKQDIAGDQSGEIVATEKPYYTMDHLLYTVRWDNGQLSKHYASELFSIGRFRTRSEFLAAFKLVGKIQLRVGPRGGFRSAKFRFRYEGEAIEAEIWNRDDWKRVIEPAALHDGVEIVKMKAEGT